MVTFETIKSEEIKFGTSNFLEIARKKAVTEEGQENEFISISRGYVAKDGQKRYKKSIAIPVNQEVIDTLAEALKRV